MERQPLNPAREFSKIILSKRLGCKTNQLKETVFEQLESMGATIEALEELINQHNNAKYQQAEEYKMQPDDTPAALLLGWTSDYLNELRNKPRSDDEIFRELVSEFPELVEEVLLALGEGNMKRFQQIIMENPDFLDAFMKKKAQGYPISDLEDEEFLL